MISTGNDIVALKDINKERTKEERFWSKILSVSESKLFHQKAFAAMSFEYFVWLLWSVKESVFKYRQRHTSDLLFSPQKMIIESIDLPETTVVTAFGTVYSEHHSFHEEQYYLSKVHVGTEVFYSFSKIYDELIHTVVGNSKKFENSRWGIKFIDRADYENQSAAVRSFVLNKLNAVFPNDRLEIRKSAAGYPILFNGAKEMNIPVSLSHHDHFIAYSFVLAKRNTPGD